MAKEYNGIVIIIIAACDVVAQNFHCVCARVCANYASQHELFADVNDLALPFFFSPSPVHGAMMHQQPPFSSSAKSFWLGNKPLPIPKDDTPSPPPTPQP